MDGASPYHLFDSYSEWRKTYRPNLTVSNLLQDLQFESVAGSLGKTLKVLNDLLAANVPPGHLLVMLLYLSSHHHEAKNILPLLAKLIECGVPMTLNAISPPRLTALHLVVAQGSVDMLEIVLDAGGPFLDIDVQTTYGHTPLELALHRRKYPCVVGLLWYGADPVPDKIYNHIMDKPENEQIECYEHFSRFFNSVEDIESKLEMLIRPRDIVSTLLPFVVPLKHKNSLKTALDKINISPLDLEETKESSLSCSVM